MKRKHALDKTHTFNKSAEIDNEKKCYKQFLSLNRHRKTNGEKYPKTPNKQIGGLRTRL